VKKKSISIGVESMNVKKSLESRIRGWFPKEPLFLNPQKNKMPNQKTKRLAKTKSLALFFMVTFTIVLGTLSLLGVFGLGSYASLAAGALAVLITVVWSVLHSKTRNQRSKPI
jgi:hypothetical protein